MKPDSLQAERLTATGMHPAQEDGCDLRLSLSKCTSIQLEVCGTQNLCKRIDSASKKVDTAIKNCYCLFFNTK